MSFKEITNNSGKKIDEYFPKKASERSVGDSVIGKYVGTRSYNRPDGQETKLYILENEDKTIGVNSSMVIDTKMEQVPEGATIKIQFNGKARSNKTGREYNDFAVFIDEDSASEDVKLPF